MQCTGSRVFSRLARTAMCGLFKRAVHTLRTHERARSPTRVRALGHLEACLAAIFGVAVLTALPRGAQRAAVATRLAPSAPPLPPPFLVALPLFFMAVLLLPTVRNLFDPDHGIGNTMQKV